MPSELFVFQFVLILLPSYLDKPLHVEVNMGAGVEIGGKACGVKLPICHLELGQPQYPFVDESSEIMAGTNGAG